jgi:hypothetical protein
VIGIVSAREGDQERIVGGGGWSGEKVATNGPPFIHNGSPISVVWLKFWPRDGRSCDQASESAQQVPKFAAPRQKTMIARATHSR